MLDCPRFLMPKIRLNALYLEETLFSSRCDTFQQVAQNAAGQLE
jgi:hypothetical protein